MILDFYEAADLLSLYLPSSLHRLTNSQ